MLAERDKTDNPEASADRIAESITNAVAAAIVEGVNTAVITLANTAGPSNGNHNRKRRMIAPNDTRNWQVSMDDPAAIVEGVDDIVQSINIILTTIPGSDPLRPEFGSNVYQYLDKPLPSVLGKIIYEATTAIGRWEKRLDVTRISASRNDAAHTVFKIEGTVVGSAEQITITTII